jgi:calpain
MDTSSKRAPPKKAGAKKEIKK